MPSASSAPTFSRALLHQLYLYLTSSSTSPSLLLSPELKALLLKDKYTSLDPAPAMAIVPFLCSKLLKSTPHAFPPLPSSIHTDPCHLQRNVPTEAADGLLVQIRQSFVSALPDLTLAAVENPYGNSILPWLLETNSPLVCLLPL